MTYEKHPYGEPYKWINISNCTIPYWKIGKGPDLVFVHGWPLDSQTWRNVVSRLSQTHCCHLFDLPGAGLSRWDSFLELRFPELALSTAEVPIPKWKSVRMDSFLWVTTRGGGIARLAAVQTDRNVLGFCYGEHGNTETLFPYVPSPLRPGSTPLCGRHLSRGLQSRDDSTILFSWTSLDR